MRGRPVQILRVKDTGYELDVKALKDILLQEKVRDKKVAILSVAGAYRQGKSFLLSFLLRYLEAEGSSVWMGGPEEPLEGFNWKSGWKGVTTGILMWSEPYIVKAANHEEVALILLDTQGAFDTQCEMGDCATVFAFSTMVSSVQVYNMSQRIQETDLHHLQLFTEFGRIAQEQNSNNIPFQKLQFLVSDWRNQQQFNWGINGGRGYLNEILSSSGSHKPELRRVREHIKSCFSDISCFLMPFPGEPAAGDLDFDGRLSGITEPFKKELANYAPLLLAPGNIVTKKIGGIEITAKELCHYFEVYITMFQGGKLPTPHSIYEATAFANHQLASERAKDHYREKMDMICSWDSPLTDSSKLDGEHLKVFQSTMALFRSIKKIGHKDLSKKAEQALQKDLNAMKAKYQETNFAKNKIEQAKLQNMKEQQQLRQKIDNMEKESKNVTDVMMRNEEAHKKKQVEFKMSLESLQKEKERMQPELEEARITGKGNQEEMKKKFDNFLKEMESRRNIYEEKENAFSKEREEWIQRLRNFELQKEALESMKYDTRIQMDAMKEQYEQQLRELRDQIQQMSKSSSCTLL